MQRRSFLLSALTVGGPLFPMSAWALDHPGNPAQVQVVDRNTGETLIIYHHRGKRYVVGTPGHRYTISLENHSGGRILAVISVDGINAVSGQTAAWNQSGYVLERGQRSDVRGWRKSQDRIAAFEFTALEDSYAARTGRPDNVGTIGIAVFREETPMTMTMPRSPDAADASSAGAAEEAYGSAGGKASAPASDASSAQHRAEPAERAARLGTGHGRIEDSRVGFTDFKRASASPDQLVVIHYDSRANLVAQGVLPPDRKPRRRPSPDPFPDSLRFVPDPPR